MCALALNTGAGSVGGNETILLWPGRAPGETGTLPAESDLNKPTDPLIADRPVIRLSNVSAPTITIYRAPVAHNTGAAVVVCPGGGYNILAWDLEGTEVCDWLNSIGVTGILLKYRVPARPGRERYAAALQDVQRAVGLIRQHAADWEIDSHRIGVLGFSAGAHLSATLAANSAMRTYPTVDAADNLSCHPDFLILIYPAYLADENRSDELNAEVGVQKGKTPPAFIAMTEDDPLHVEGAVAYYRALKNAGVPAEMHLYPVGGHGYGLRRTANPVTAWPDRVADWLEAGGWLKPAK
jgi:acetyl esterase/lipase